MKNIEEKKKISSAWFQELRNNICNQIEEIEELHSKSKKKFLKKKWLRDKEGSKKLGGGEMMLLRGEVFEKAGVNISTVFGKLSKNLIGRIPGTKKKPHFWASGISLVIHPVSPKIPAIHMNTRFLVTEKCWFGGGTDITPSDKKSNESKIISKYFHHELKKICENYRKGSYQKYKKWCDDYFFLPHRNESRGLGGIFFDYLNSGSWNSDMDFTKNVGTTFINSYKKIVLDNINSTWNSKDKELQNHRRSRYVEFNLLYDRGTKFGLETNGNIDAIFMSLPPFASW
ncbi:MAG: oxygen-dependent coproporphyrinogen oxidase [Pseudomonadota bacterium]|nr:oxygen-dependent coproporphyrinogen oxidase [Pseudomonadota bacterium]